MDLEGIKSAIDDLSDNDFQVLLEWLAEQVSGEEEDDQEEGY